MKHSEISKLFTEGEIIRSGGGRSSFELRKIDESYVSIVPGRGKSKATMRLKLDQLTAVIANFAQVNPKQIERTIQLVLVHAGLDSEHTTEVYLYGFAREFRRRKKLSRATIYADELPREFFGLEGAKKTVLVNRYERSTRARLRCIEDAGARCSICEMTFIDMYGTGRDFMHAHHLIPLQEIGKSYKVTSKDLIAVCPNCHSMLHWKRKQFPLHPEKLKVLYQKQQRKNANRIEKATS